MYKIMGADQREYGPVTSDGVREWIAQGRANAQTLACFEGAPWKPLSTFPEFADVLRTAVPPPIAGGASPYTLQVQQTNKAAVAGLVLSILGLCCLPSSLIGLVLSIIGLVQIRKNPQAYSTSIVVPIAGIVLALFSVAATILAFATGAFDQVWRQINR